MCFFYAGCSLNVIIKWHWWDHSCSCTSIITTALQQSQTDTMPGPEISLWRSLRLCWCLGLFPRAGVYMSLCWTNEGPLSPFSSLWRSLWLSAQPPATKQQHIEATCFSDLCKWTDPITGLRQLPPWEQRQHPFPTCLKSGLPDVI